MTSQLLLLLLLSGTGCIAQTSSPRDGGGDSELTTDSSLINETPALEVPVATQTPFNCLAEWLILAGASHDKATMIAQSQQAKRSGLDEITITRFEDFVLSILLGFDTQLATQLKRCIVRSTTCPTGAMTTKFPCSKTGKCVFNQEQESTLCQCPAGLTGERCEVDIDECQNEPLNDCDDKMVATCFNSYGSYACECRSGYEGDGRDCPDLDECASDSHSCHHHANCTNTIGSYTCLCQVGYQGNGTRCEVDVCASSANSRLCRKIESIDTYNKHLEKKLKQRDRQIVSLFSDVKLISTVFTRYHHTISDLGTRLRNTEVKLQDARQDLDNTKQDLTTNRQQLTATRQDLTNTRNNLTTTRRDLTSTKEDSTSTKEDLTSTKEDLKSTKEDLTSTKEDLKSTKEDLKSTKEDLKSTKQNLTTTRHDLTTTKRDLTTTQQDLISAKRDLTTTQHDLTSTKRDLTTTQQDLTTTKRDLTTTQQDLTSTKRDLTTTQQDLTTTQQDLTSTRQELTTTKRELTTTQHNLTRLDHDLPARVASNEQIVHILTKEVKRHDKQCGIVSWKSYSQQTGSTKRIHPWSVVYNKTRSDTILRVQYTSIFGVFSYSSQWSCFTISIRINNTECADPAPIKSGATAYTQSPSSTRTILPGAISGTCRINATGQLTFSTHIEKHCYSPGTAKYDGFYIEYDGYYRQSGQRITATLHVEELCPN